MLGDQPRLERPLTIARHVDRPRPVIGQDGLAARPIAMIRGVVGLGAMIAFLKRRTAASSSSAEIGPWRMN